MTVKVMEKGGRDFSREDLEAIASLCGVPLDFLLHGFHAVAEVNDTETRVIIDATRQVANEALAKIDERFDELGELLSETAAEAIAKRAVGRLRPRRPDRERESRN